MAHSGVPNHWFDTLMCVKANDTRMTCHSYYTVILLIGSNFETLSQALRYFERSSCTRNFGLPHGLSGDVKVIVEGYTCCRFVYTLLCKN